MKIIFFLFILTGMCQDHSSYIFDSKNKKSLSNWNVVDDRVMGGLSQGKIALSDAGNALFSGYVTTENNGGFSSVRYGFDKKEVSEFKNVVLKVKGDGKSYQFRLKESSSQRFSYIAAFTTSGDWETISLSLDSFYPSFRGTMLDQPNFPGEVIEEIAVLIGNKTKESFALEIESIYLE